MFHGRGGRGRRCVTPPTGVRAALLCTAEAYARTRNCSYIILVTETDRQGARYFYDSSGYQSDGVAGFKKTLPKGTTG